VWFEKEVERFQGFEGFYAADYLSNLLNLSNP
jgi:hypothetical protein